ncbi:MAG: hypothetical protein ACOCRO_02405 [Halanaerobiales bacterium]
MRKLGILVLAFALVVGMSLGVMAEEETLGENIADIEQTGNNNSGGITQEGEESIIFDAWITQNGSSNTATLDQATEVAETVLAGIYQDGKGNLANVEQGDHETWVTQIGDWNEADIITSARGKANVYQEGNSNLIDVEQSGTGYMDVSMEVDAKQVNTDNSTIYVNQSDYGNANLRQIDQDNSSITVDNSPNSPYDVDVQVYQGLDRKGEGNVANVYANNYQNADGSSGNEQNVLITQDGNWNTANINQSSFDTNFDATISQTGDSNDAVINQ